MLKNLSQGGKHWSLFDKENTNLTCCICIESSSLPCCLDKWLYGMLILIHQLVIQCVKSACRVSDGASRSQYIYRCAELLTDSKSYVWSQTSYLQSNDKLYEGKCCQFYEQRYTRFVRVAHASNLYYIGSVVWAEMKKQTSYKVDISLDTHGVVHEAQCECGAGQGHTAHCKHVTTVLYALHRLSVDGSVLTEQTCTQVLQTFHHVKPYTGSPMTTADLHKLRSQNYIYDPRPKERINCSAYQSHFRNTVLGFQTKERMPLTQLYKPANPYALFSDHQYLQSSDLFLQQET